jgi:hypothetical protein
MKTKLTLIVALTLFAFATRVNADLVQVDIYGTVAQNNYTPSSPLNAVAVGSPAHTSFQVDSNSFINSPSFPVRGYSIIPSSFLTTLGSTNVVLSSATHPPQPFFSIRDNDPQVDGFVVTNTVDAVNPTPTNFAAANFNLVTSYPKTTLSSLDILGALGSYNTTGLSLLEYDLEFGESIGIDINYSNMTIALLPEPTVLGLLAIGLPILARRRRVVL